MIKRAISLKIFFLVGFLFLSSILMLISSYHSDVVVRIREKSYVLIGSFPAAGFHVKSNIVKFIEDIRGSRRLREENKVLKDRLAQLIFQEKNYYQRMVSTNERLKKMLEFQQKQPYELLPVQVVAYAPRDYFKVFFLGKGKKEEIEKEMVVVNAQGLVGRVIEVYPHQAKVLTILDERSKVGVRNERTGDVAILQGMGKACELKYLLTKVSAEVEDEIVTSGLGGFFPKGILVGRISRVKKNPNRLFQEVEVVPSVDFGKLEELFVIKK
ncbi:rod shape-determining protein MreC [Candidatus Aerophobetes bacterium]|uniref:Cell shape-determining protein MreC n=1 Tax=Aerophobetes bacterium TaxID=2030807 RepID=A0A523YLH2_UNCAE|nr:MAG: rod shape-determining protein MreC [Candidatus Aerophobetes bacterium]